MAEIPGKKTRWFFERKWLVESVSVVPPIIAAGYTAQTAAQYEYAPFLWGGIVWLFIASVIKVAHAYHQDKETKVRDAHDGLSAALRVLYAVVAKHSDCGDKHDGAVRVTIHRVVPPLDKPEKLEQLVAYVGGEGGSAFREFPIRSGIAGRVAREKTAYTYARQSDNHEAFVAELVRIWGFTEADVRSLRSDRKSWMAVPIFSPHHVVEAVVYLDSNRKDLFNDGAKSLIINCCGGIAEYISERYKS